MLPLELRSHQEPGEKPGIFEESERGIREAAKFLPERFGVFIDGPRTLHAVEGGYQNNWDPNEFGWLVNAKSRVGVKMFNCGEISFINLRRHNGVHAEASYDWRGMEPDPDFQREMMESGIPQGYEKSSDSFVRTEADGSVIPIDKQFFQRSVEEGIIDMMPVTRISKIITTSDREVTVETLAAGGLKRTEVFRRI